MAACRDIFSFSLNDQSPLQTIFTYLLVEGTFRGMNELIVMTGSAGGIGSHLVRELSRRNYRIIATDHDLDTLRRVSEEQRWHPDVILEALDVETKHGGQSFLRLWKLVTDGLIS